MSVAFIRCLQRNRRNGKTTTAGRHGETWNRRDQKGLIRLGPDKSNYAGMDVSKSQMIRMMEAS